MRLFSNPSLLLSSGFAWLFLEPKGAHSFAFTRRLRSRGHTAAQKHDLVVDDFIEDNNQQDGASAAVGIYIHIPFCRRRCRYCDFAILPIGSQRDDDDNDRHATRMNLLFENYTRAVVQEIESIVDDDQTIALDTVYLGGGTPSLAPLSMLQQVMAAVTKKFVLSPNLEFTMEMDPGTFDRTKLQGFRALGVNRVSLGVQSFDDHVLEYLGRFHRAADIDHSLHLLREVMGEDCNYSLDLIASLPGVSLADWCTTLAMAIRLDPPPKHISVYDLTIESGTVFGKWYDPYDSDYDSTGKVVLLKSQALNSNHRPLPSPEESAFQYQYTAGYLRASGYEHYEISSYALPGFRSAHNQLYWAYKTTWYAAGLGSTSFVNGSLTPRPRAMSDYIAWVENRTHEEGSSTLLCLYGDEDDNDNEEDSPVSQLQELVMKRLRTKEGLNLEIVRRQYGSSHVDAILQGACLDLGELVVYEPPILRLKDSKGFMFSNSIISSIWSWLDRS